MKLCLSFFMHFGCDDDRRIDKQLTIHRMIMACQYLYDKTYSYENSYALYTYIHTYKSYYYSYNQANIKLSTY